MTNDQKRIKEVFLAAAELSDGSAQAAYLDQACGGDARLRERVEALLRSHDPAGSFLGTPAAAMAGLDDAATLECIPSGSSDRTTNSESPDNNESDDLSFLTPSNRPESLGRIGHYEVLQLLGKGGFGIVFRAFDDILQRVVAIKVMAPQLAATSPARKRFLREARTSAAVRHENVVQVYEVGEQPLPYLAMEFIPGETLQQRLDRTGPLDVQETLRIGRQIAEGLTAAHANDLIHRDIKPGNVMLEGGQHKVKITDFGLARATDDASMTQSGMIAGTPMYMAPEQALGQTLDQRADLFSLGSVLYQIVSGRPPFRATSTVAVLKRVAEDTPRPIREVIPETPQWLCDIISKLHAKNPDDRYQSAREVTDVLADCEAQLNENAKLKDFSRIPLIKSNPRQPGLGKWLAAAGLLFVIIISFAWRQGRMNQLVAGPHQNRPGTVSGPIRWGDVVDPRGDCDFTGGENSLTISVPGGSNHDLNPLPEWNNLDAPRVLREVDGDFEARVTIRSPIATENPMTARRSSPYIGAGLVLMRNKTNIVRLFRSKLNDETSLPYTHAHCFVGGSESVQETLGIGEGPIHLRIRRIGEAILLAHSTNGRDWTNEDAATGFSTSGPMELGVAVVNSTDQRFTVRFEGFEVQELPASPPIPFQTDGFVSLFNGEDLTGWKTHPDQPGNWKVESGAIVGYGPQASQLFSERGNFGDFHLRMEAKLNAKGESSIFFRCPYSFPFRFGDVGIPAGFDIDMKGNGKTVAAGQLSLLGSKPLLSRVSIAPDTWFTLEIVAQAKRIVARVNGRITADYLDPDGQFTSGHLTLQTLGSDTLVEFRKIEIKELLSGSSPRPR